MQGPLGAPKALPAFPQRPPLLLLLLLLLLLQVGFGATVCLNRALVKKFN